MGFEQGYNINVVGSWPHEKYDITPITPNMFSLGAINDYSYTSKYFYIKNPTIEIDNIHKNASFFSYTNIGQSEVGGETLISWNDASSKLTLDLSEIRKNEYGPFSHFFKMFGNNSKTLYSFVNFPKRLFLYPVSAKKITVGGVDSYVLTTSAVIMDNVVNYFNVPIPESENAAPNAHENYIKGPGNFDYIYNNVSNPVSLMYDISANQTIIKKTFSVGDYSNINLQPELNYKKLRNDFFFINGGFSYWNSLTEDDANGNPYNKIYLETLLYKYTDELEATNPYTSNLVFYYYPIVDKNVQTFSYVQSSNNVNIPITNSSCSMLSAVVYLNSGTVKYYQKTKKVGTTTVSVVSATNKELGFSYILDSDTFLYSRESVIGTLDSYYIHGTPAYTKTNIGAAVSLSTSQKNDTVTFVTKYPPYYYTYSAAIKSNTLTNATEKSNLDFYLVTEPITDTTQVSFSAKTSLYADYGTMQLELSTYSNVDEKIFFQPEFTTDDLLSDITVYYKKAGVRTIYDLTSPTWLDANDASVLEIENPPSYVGNPVLTIRPKMSTVCGLKDGFLASKIRLTGKFQPPTYDLVVNTIKEDNDYIDISADSMVTDAIAPGLDLRDTTIKWTVSPFNSNVKINYLSKDSTGKYSPVNYLTNNTLVTYNNTSWAVRVSGYGGTPTTITLYSTKQNKSASITTDTFFYNAFVDKKLLINPKISLDNSGEIRTITLEALVPYKNRIVNLPLNEELYWSYTYTPDNAPTGFSSITAPITARFQNGNYYEKGESSKSQLLSSLKFFIQPQRSTNPNLNKISITVNATNTSDNIYGNYEIDLDDFPAESVASADFKIAYFAFQNEILLDTKKQQNTLTRSSTQTTNYICIPYIDPNLAYTSIEWSMKDPNGAATIQNILQPVYNLTTLGKYELTLTYKGAKTPTWNSRHDITKTVTLYKIDASVFNKKLNFITYPEYTWKNSDQITIVNSSNYTLATSPTAYSYKKSKTESFSVSSDGIFDRFVYAEGPTKKILKDSENYIYNDNIKNITIDYSTRLESTTGTTIYLSAYNKYYPYNTPLYYRALESGVLITRSYNITAESIPYNLNTPSNQLFFQNPKIVDYNGITHTFSAIITSFDLDFSRNIFIQQKFKTNPLNTPAKILTDSSTVVYTLSTPKWISQKQLPAVDGIYKVFSIKPGDDMSPLRVSDVNKNTLYLNASSNLNIKIPESTFDTINTGNLGLRYGGDLWDSKQININNRSTWETLVAYTTSTQPEIFLNTFYALSGDTVFVQFKTPEYSVNPISAYAVNFGGKTNQIKLKSETFYNTFTDLGTFYVTYSAIYQNSSKKTFIEKIPFVIKNKWQNYDEQSVRIISESILELPYTLNDIQIQPNEFGDADIFNTALIRINDNLNYLKNNIQTMNSFAPSHYYGWMGSNRENQSGGIRWYTQSYGSEFYDVPTYTTNIGSSYFTNIKDIFFGKYIYVLDENKFRLFETDKNCKEIKFLNASDLDDLFFDPRSIVLNSDESTIYVADSIKNRIYRFDLDFSDIDNPIFSLVLSVGTIGAINDTSKFDFPSELCFNNDYVYVLDYNNNCVKQYSSDLSWVHTYYDNVLENDQILNMAVHETGLLYIITKNLKVHIFDTFSDNVYSTFETSEIGTSEIVKLSFDESGEFLYIVTKLNVFKYTSLGEYVTTFNLPTVTGLEFTSCRFSSNRGINISTKTSILRFQDFVQLYKIGDGLEAKYWTIDQILLKKEEFATDLNYNLALNRTAQNIKTFRNSLNGKFVLVTEQTARGMAKYFSLIPLSNDDISIFEDDVEYEKLKIGTNEFHVPSVINRELSKIYNSLLKLKENLDVTPASSNSSDGSSNSSNCGGEFCWSWKAMSCYDLTLPLIRLCSINPITYAELTSTFPVNYAPTKQWKDAVSNCCNEYASPLI
jgi:hypothetical protein